MGGLAPGPEVKMARSSETVLQLGSKTLAGLGLALTKEERIRLPHFKSAGKSSENVCGVIVGEHFTFLSTINLTVIYYKILQFYLL